MNELLNGIIISVASIAGTLLVKIAFDRCTRRGSAMDSEAGQSVARDPTQLRSALHDIYWPVYFRLTACLVVKEQMALNRGHVRPDALSNIETSIVFKNHDEVLEILAANAHWLAADGYMLDLVTRYLTHVVVYKNLRAMGIRGKTPSQYGVPYPDEFTTEIRRRTLEAQHHYAVMGRRASVSGWLQQQSTMVQSLLHNSTLSSMRIDPSQNDCHDQDANNRSSTELASDMNVNLHDVFMTWRS